MYLYSFFFFQFFFIFVFIIYQFVICCIVVFSINFSLTFYLMNDSLKIKYPSKILQMPKIVNVLLCFAPISYTRGAM